MAEFLASSSSRESKLMVFIIDSDIVDAAQQLIELSDEDKSTRSSTIRGSKRSRWDHHLEEEEEEEVDQIQKAPSDDDGIVMAKIQEIFGNDVVEVFQPPKKQKIIRYRSLVNIYMATNPIDASGINTRVRA